MLVISYFLMMAQTQKIGAAKNSTLLMSKTSYTLKVSNLTLKKQKKLTFKLLNYTKQSGH